MGLFTKIKAKRAAKQVLKQQPTKDSSNSKTVIINEDGDSIDRVSSTSSSSNNGEATLKKKMRKIGSFRSGDASMNQVPNLILDLESAVQTSSSRTKRSLKMLFSLSEQVETNNRIEMVKIEGGRLAHALLSFLSKCPPKSSEQYLALLVLNNISIPAENKFVSRIFLDLVSDSLLSYSSLSNRYNF